MEEETTIFLPYHTPFAAIAPRFSGSLSAIASGLIIVAILKSDTKMKTVYHRIMFFMSCADISASIAMALTTIPMPQHMSQEIMDIDGDLSFYEDWAGDQIGKHPNLRSTGFLLFLWRRIHVRLQCHAVHLLRLRHCIWHERGQDHQTRRTFFASRCLYSWIWSSGLWFEK